jgi:hypothetical protein
LRDRNEVEPERRFLIAEVLRPYVSQLVALIPGVIIVIEEGLVARKTDEAD